MCATRSVLHYPLRDTSFDHCSFQLIIYLVRLMTTLVVFGKMDALLLETVSSKIARDVLLKD